MRQLHRRIQQAAAKLQGVPMCVECIGWSATTACAEAGRCLRPECCPRCGRQLWEKIKQTAWDELAVGKTAAEAIEGSHERPMRRAEYLALWVALADGLRSANGAERLLIDNMAQALMLHRHWLHHAVQLDFLDESRLQRANNGRDRYEPPRLSEVAAVDWAAQVADRFQRQFLRLMKCFRDGRRLIASLTVLGGQVSVADQQINVAPASSRDPD